MCPIYCVCQYSNPKCSTYLPCRAIYDLLGRQVPNAEALHVPVQTRLRPPQKDDGYAGLLPILRGYQQYTADVRANKSRQKQPRVFDPIPRVLLRQPGHNDRLLHYHLLPHKLTVPPLHVNIQIVPHQQLKEPWRGDL